MPSATLVDEMYVGTSNLARIAALHQYRRVSPASMVRGLTVAVLNLDRADLIIPLAESAGSLAEGLGHHGMGFQMLIGDTGSTDPEVVGLLESPPASVECVTGLEYHFSRSNNDLCDGRVRHDHLLLLNNDVLLRSADPLISMLECLRDDPQVGIVGLVLDFPDGTLQHGGVDLVRTGPMRGLPVHIGSRSRRSHAFGESWPAIAVTGAALMVRTELWAQLGGLDESYDKECQDVDLCLRAHRLGWRTRVLDAGPLIHEENGTRPKGEEHWADRRLFLRRWMAYTEAAFL